jgi:hypothetical protein
MGGRLSCGNYSTFRHANIIKAPSFLRSTSSAIARECRNSCDARASLRRCLAETVPSLDVLPGSTVRFPPLRALRPVERTPRTFLQPGCKVGRDLTSARRERSSRARQAGARARLGSIPGYVDILGTDLVSCTLPPAPAGGQRHLNGRDWLVTTQSTRRLRQCELLQRSGCSAPKSLEQRGPAAPVWRGSVRERVRNP